MSITLGRKSAKRDKPSSYYFCCLHYPCLFFSAIDLSLIPWELSFCTAVAYFADWSIMKDRLVFGYCIAVAMVLGPMLDIKLIFMYLNVIRKRAIMTLAVRVLLTVFLSTAI
jgi:uncharacterized membrane protein YraQ (UPF0718 family)